MPKDSLALMAQWFLVSGDHTGMKQFVTFVDVCIVQYIT